MSFDIDNLGTYALAPQSIPTDFQQVEWIRPTANIYIDTDVVAKSGVSIELTFSDFARNGSQAENLLFGATNNSWGQQVGVNNSYAQSQLLSYYYYGGYTYKPYATEGVLKLTDGKLYLDDVLQYNGSKGSFNTNRTLYLFASNWSGYARYHSRYKLIGCIMRQDGTNLREYVPCYCKKSVTAYRGSTQVVVDANTVGICDKINAKFYVPNNLGYLEKGNDC